ncbi:MAG: hypothetical protein EOL86_09860 [Deltaproteobacteria bacterium]|nr:hypothetical protein [Deltaproteobacteria bacterium]
MDRSIERRRTIRIRRSALTAARLDDIDKPGIKVAETKEELEQAFRLVYEEYYDQGYIPNPHPRAMLYSIYNFLPKTCVFIFQAYRDVISTIAFIPDSALFGLPMDALYKDEIDELRRQGRKVVEIGSLATEKTLRGKNVVMYLYKTVINYGLMTGVNDLCLTVNPKHVRFYNEIMLCEQIGEEKYYPTVGAPAVLMRADFDSYAERLMRAYAASDFETDLASFFLKLNTSHVDQNIQSLGYEHHEFLDYDAARYFFQQRPEILEELDPERLAYIERVYHKALFVPSMVPWNDSLNLMGALCRSTL